jgi:carbonic anhydrase/acetyltransferase-like protein (isoleucine patch superfamily)
LSSLRELVVFGDRTADEIVDVVETFFGDRFSRVHKCYCDKQTFGDDQLPAMSSGGDQVGYLLGLVDIHLQVKIDRACKRAGWEPVSVIHPAANVSRSAKIGPGCFVAAGCAISVNAELGAHCLVHFNSSIGHDAVLGDYCSVLPGARISGQVRLDEGVLIGSNAFVFQNVHIGAYSQVDALTYVREDLAARQIVSCRAKRPLRRLDLPPDFSI